jgi:hypothetical protein|tara:strand:+ start:83 stop:262 length:180 start_codon:yes stop_codon:yes gene_type:complete
MKKIKVVKKPGQGKVTSKKDFKPKKLEIPEKDKKFIPFAEYMSQAGSAARSRLRKDPVD